MSKAAEQLKAIGGAYLNLVDLHMQATKRKGIGPVELSYHQLGHRQALSQLSLLRRLVASENRPTKPEAKPK